MVLVFLFQVDADASTNNQPTAILTIEGTIPEKETKKKIGREPYRINRESQPLSLAKNYIGTAIQRATQRFIRWLRQQLYQHLPWHDSMRLLSKFWLINPT